MSSTRFESWITAIRIDRLTALMRLIPSRQVNGMPRKQASRLLFPSIGGSLDEVAQCIQYLRYLMLVDDNGDRLSRTREGDALAKRIKKNGPDEVSVHLLRSGALANSIRTALPLGLVEGEHLTFDLVALRKAAPQLLSLFSRLSSVTVESRVRLPLAVAAELETAWNQVQHPGPAPLPSIDINLQVGDRAELYSLELEQSAFIGASSFVDWVSRDDPRAGYDIEVRSSRALSRMIEVKGSRGTQTSFILSTNELAKAQILGERYEIHFWGDVRLSLSAQADYRRLRDLGYPEIVVDPAVALFNGSWSCEPSEYKVRRKSDLT